MPVWVLDSGTTGLLDLFGQAPRIQIALYPQAPGDGQSLFRSGMLQFAQIPKRPHSVIRKGPMIKGLKIGLSRFVCHSVLPILEYAEDLTQSRR
jgi:hypothetical protein